MRSVFLIISLAVALVLGSIQNGVSQSADDREIVIHYRENGAAIPPPRREGNNYVVAIPRSCDPVPQELIAPFVNTIEGENEVWRFEIMDNAPVTVAQMSNGTVRLRLKGRQTGADSAPVQRHAIWKPPGAGPDVAPSVAKSSDDQGEVDANGNATNTAVTATSVTTISAPPSLNVNANGSALSVAEISQDPGVSTVKDSKLPLANLDLSVPQSPAFAILGITPDNIIRPGSPRDLALSLLNGVGKNGAFQSGIAIDTAPYLLFAGRLKTLSE